MRHVCFRAVVVILAGVVTLRAQGPPGQLTTLPLTQLDERALAADLDNRTFTFSFAQPVPVREALLTLVRGTSLSVIPDPEITGSFAGELKNVTVRQALALILPALGLEYAVDGGFVKVFRRERETRLYDINYIASQRRWSPPAGAPERVGGEGGASVSSTPAGDVFVEIAEGLRTVVSDRATFNVDRQAGLLQVTDFREQQERVALYLDTVHDRVNRQLQLDARVIEVELREPGARSLDWTALARLDEAASPPAVGRPMLTGLRPGDIPKFLAALAAQGAVTTLASPRIVVLNNQPALVRATSQVIEGDNGARPRLESVTLGVTAQVAAEGVVMLSVNPFVSIQDERQNDEFPLVVATREADTLVRLAAGNTLILGGFAREREVRERGGWFGRGTVTRKRVELVILLTPTIVGSPGTL